MSDIVDTVEDRIQNAILTAIDSIVAPKIELAIRSINASSGRDATNVTANSERGEHIGKTSPFQNSSENNNVLPKSKVNDETQNNIPNKVSELSVPATRFDRQPHTHHNKGNTNTELSKLSKEEVYKENFQRYCGQTNLHYIYKPVFFV